MSGHGGQEVELKLLLPDEAALRRLEQTLVRGGTALREPVEQRNRFLDTPAATLRGRALTLRLREEAGRFELTLKGPARIRDDLHTRVELEVDLRADQAAAILAGTLDPLARLALDHAGEPLLAAASTAVGPGPLVEVGSFRNVRTRAGPLRLGAREVWLELDRTRLPDGRTDFELELELPPGLEGEGRRLLEALLAQAQVEGAPAESKVVRFFRALEESG